MVERIRLEEIYDASADDECFDALSVRFARMLGARSGVIHWRRAGDGWEHEISYSGYFSPDQMDLYDRQFAGQDLWSNAIQSTGVTNVALDCDRLVPPEVYANSPIYNDWIRPMGDDSFHALGAALRTKSVIAEIGFHRGKSQGGFGPEAAELLNDYVVHLTRCLDIREKLKRAETHAGAASSGLDVIGYGVFTLSSTGRVLHHNEAAEALLQRNDGFRLIAGKLCAMAAGDRTLFAEAIERAAASTAPQPAALQVRGESDVPYEASVVSASTPAGRRIMVIVRDPALRDPSLVERLRSRYALTAAEAEIAVRLSEGYTVARLSDERRTSLETLRSQTKAIASKLGCQRQPEIVAVVRNLPHLHPSRTSS